MLLDVLFDELEDLGGTLIRHQPAGDFEMRFGRSNCFAPVAGEAAPDAVEVDGRAGPAQLLHRVALLTQDGRDAGFFHELLIASAFGDRGDIGTLFLGQWADIVVKAFDGD